MEDREELSRRLNSGSAYKPGEAVEEAFCDFGMLCQGLRFEKGTRGSSRGNLNTPIVLPAQQVAHGRFPPILKPAPCRSED